MANQENKSKYWMRKFQEAGWSDFRELEVGSVFETSVSNHIQMADRIGDIIFWYKSDSDKGIYFITQVISEVYPSDNNTKWGMDLKVLKTIIKNPIIPEDIGFSDLMNTIKDRGQAGAVYNLTVDDKPEKLYELIKGNAKIEFAQLGGEEINHKDLELLEKIKEKNINDGTMFNPFLDMNLVRNEVRHLSFLTNLLNPNGTHHQGTKFLNLFMDRIINYETQIDNKLIENFCNVENINVQTEKKTPNGRIDIWIENDEYIIAIEGKTETVDSKGQLKKYDDYLQKQHKPYLLIYLTMTGEQPTYECPENLQIMDFNDDILTFVEESLEIKMPNKILETLNEYFNALTTYLNNLNRTWSYDLDIIQEITKDKESYLKYENIKNNYFYNTEKYKYSVVEDVANVFEKAKAKIERNFFWELVANISSDLEKEGFTTDDEFDDNYKLGLATDIEEITKARKERLKNEISEELIQSSRYGIAFENTISENENIRLIIQNDFQQLHVYFNHNKNDELVNWFEDNDITLMEGHEFLSNNISKFLDNDYMTKCVKECKIKILNESKQIEM